MNKVILSGRWTKDPEVKYNGDLAIAKGTLAVDRKGKKEGEPTADFIQCTAFGKPAESIEKYCVKGQKVIVTGRIQTSDYTNKDGVRVFKTDVIIEDFPEFCEKKAASTGLVQEGQVNQDGFIDAAKEAEEVFNY